MMERFEQYVSQNKSVLRNTWLIMGFSLTVYS